MCGITGVFDYRHGRAVDAATLRSMCDALEHRGPDDRGEHLDGPLGLAMRRLAIIDPAHGEQPLYSEDRRVVAVANGEIYNHASWRSRLRARGHTLHGGSDCEVIVHLYEERGLDVVEALRGMFGFALYDANARRLLLARDRIGIKPLYYADVDGVLVFGSELKALLRYPALRRELDENALHHYLSLNYLPAPWTLIRGVRQLCPGELLVVEAGAEAGPRLRTYWQLRYDADETLGEAEHTRAVRDALRDCVASHMMSDVPFGAFLSGGVDSSAVVAMMAGQQREPVQTFSIDFTEESFSEARYARAVAERFGCSHHELTASAELVELLDELCWYADDPLADSSMIPVYLLAGFARERVKMVLTGDGGDEIFAGYPTYTAYWVRRLYRLVPGALRRQLVARAARALPVSLTKVSFDFMAKRFVAGAELDAEQAHFFWRVILTEQQKNALYQPSFRERLSAGPTDELFRASFAEAARDGGAADPLAQMLYVDTRVYLPADMLAKVDRMTMANALEARVPLLDHELVELAARVPSSLKLRRFRDKKYVLRQALRGTLDDEILDRKKAGFNVPVNRWLAGDLSRFAREVLAPDRIEQSGVFDGAAVTRLLDEHVAQRHDHSFGLFSLLCFQLWYERFVAADRVAPPPRARERWPASA